MLRGKKPCAPGRYPLNSNQEIIVLGDPSAAAGMPTSWTPNPVQITQNPPDMTSGELVVTHEQDMNGDGVVDFIYEESAGLQSNPGAALAPYASFPSALNPPSYPLARPLAQAVGGPPFSAHWADVNGDGLLDAFDNSGNLWINLGGPVSFSIFSTTTFAMPTFTAFRALFRSFVMDVDGDGMDELVVPSQRSFDLCGGTDPVQFFPSGDPKFWCGDEWDTAPQEFWSVDQSIFTYDVYKFHEHADGSFTLDLTPYSPGAPFDPTRPPLNLQAPINNISVTPGDVTGDGLADLTFSLHLSTGNSHYIGITANQLGVYVVRNKSGAPDLLTNVTNGLVATAAWTHRPLTYSPLALDLAASGQPAGGLGNCTLPTGSSAFYTLSGDGSNSPGYSFFTSSMWTVSSFETSNGVAGTNRICYAYQDAMLSDWGRGFQGFRFITQEEQFGSTSGADQNRTTTTEFHQEFPLVGKPKKVTTSTVVGAPASTANLSVTKTWWHQMTAPEASRGWVVYSSGSLDTEYDPGPGHAVLAQKTSIVEIDPPTGEATTRCSLLENATVLAAATAGGASALTDLASVETSTLTPDTANWFLGKISDRTTSSAFWPTSKVSPMLSSANAFTESASSACQTRVTGTLYRPDSKATVCGNMAPNCSTLDPTSTVNPPLQVKTQETKFTWMAPGENGYPNKLKESDVMVAGATSPESATQFAYDAFGNVQTTTVTGRDACPAATCAAAAGTSKTTTITYDTGGGSYFPSAVKDPLGRNSETTFVPETGAPACVQEVQGVTPKVCKNYDALGRLSEVTNSIDPTHNQEIRTSACEVAGDCTFKTQTFQAGAPTSTVYADLLGRPRVQGVEGLDGKEIVTRTDYNLRGQKVTEYPPAVTPNPAGTWTRSFVSSYPITHVYDVLGRETSKTVLRDPSLFNGQGDASITTTYAYAIDPALGLTTSITLPKAAAVGGALQMSRTYDRAGHLVKTTQQLTPTHAVVASYFYDPMGSVTKIVDPGLNAITATYDDLGRKQQMSDPDKGTSNYFWDGLGRLRTETDGNGLVSLYVYDEAGRKIARQVNGSSVGNWTYAPSSGALTSVSGGDGFLRTYVYDNFLRPIKVTTHAPASNFAPTENWAAHDFVEQYAYDTLYGRMKAIEYPSGETVRLDYQAQRGFPIGETQMTIGATGTAVQGTIYRQATAMSARGMPTTELLGNGITETTKYDDSLGLAQVLSASFNGLVPTSPPAACAQVAGTVVQCLEYKYDQFSNLAQQKKLFFPSINGTLSTLQATATEVYQYDDLQRLLAESRSYTNFTPASTLSESYTYDDTGNILSKSDFGSPYVYGGATRPRGAGPHAVLTVGAPAGWSYTYDTNGNMLSDGQRTVAYDDQDRPEQLTMNGVTTIFRYTPDGDRYLQRTTSAADTTVNRTIYYVDKDYERVDWDQRSNEERTYCGKGVVIEQKDGSPREPRYLHLDRLGSTDAVTDASGVEKLDDAHGFDAFGRPRGRDWQPSSDQMHPSGEWGTATNHGFTGHEQLDETYLTHMNGRVYDYRLGRFLSVDPMISNPASTQAINPYSYIGNNPLSGTDPSGYCSVVTGGRMCGIDKGGGDGALMEIAGVTVHGDSGGLPQQGSATITSLGSGIMVPLDNGAAPNRNGAQNNGTPTDALSPSATGKQSSDAQTAQGEEDSLASDSVPGLTRDTPARTRPPGSPCPDSDGCTTLTISPEVVWRKDSRGRLTSWQPMPNPQIFTRFNPGVNPEDDAEFGVGTRTYAHSGVDDHDRSLRAHESSHYKDFEAYLDSHPLPLPALKVGMTEAEARSVVLGPYTDALVTYKNDAKADSIRRTDCVGIRWSGC
jgi:RHS repeat-associated protein